MPFLVLSADYAVPAAPHVRVHALTTGRSDADAAYEAALLGSRFDRETPWQLRRLLELWELPPGWSSARGQMCFQDGGYCDGGARLLRSNR